MASFIENSELEPQSKQPSSAADRNSVSQKTKATKSAVREMAETSGHDVVSSQSVEPPNKHSSGGEQRQHSSWRGQQHRSANNPRKGRHHYNASARNSGPRDQRSYKAGKYYDRRQRDRDGSKQDTRQGDVPSSSVAECESKPETDNRAESAKNAGDEGGRQEDGGQRPDDRERERKDGGYGRRSRNRPYQSNSKRGRSRDGEAHQSRPARPSKDKECEGQFEERELRDASSQFSDRGRYSRGGSSTARGRRPRRSDKEWWRGEERGEKEQRYHRDGHSERREFDRTEVKSGSKRRPEGDGSKSDPSEKSDSNASPNVIDTSDRSNDMQVPPVSASDAERISKSAVDLDEPVSDKSVKRLTKPSHSKPKSYDYTKPKPDSTSSINGKEFSSSSKYKGRSHHHPKVGRKDFTPTIQSDELAQQLLAETYECMVCCDSVREKDQIWSCQGCYHIFHLRCIKKWASAPTFAPTDEDTTPEGWQCPSCRNTSMYVPTIYRCYCGKCINPRRRSKGELTVPHSCGELCKKKLGMTPESSCRHQCQLPCHPGPCPPCPVMVTRSCPCGRKKHQVRCSKTGDLPSCEATCGKTLDCGRHDCQEKCHPGPCPSCSVSLQLTCHCGRTKKDVLCGETKEMAFSCQQICNRELDCGNHLCERPCHVGACLSCSLLPANVTHCPCGAEPVASLLSEENQRISCLDPVPTCNRTCGKTLPCSTPEVAHTCESVCHLGECPPCTKTTMVLCRCGRNSVERPCADLGKDGEFVCRHVCNKKKSCGRHRCNTRCCKDDDHVCELKCGKKLQCGLHSCQENCHRGYCQPCWEYSYDELTCRCGAEVIYPPIPCGTRPPVCSQPCGRLHSCSHPVNHTCHSDDHCPKCTFLTEKMCMGGHEMRFNIPCHLTDVSCGNLCGKTLPCGMHKCKRTCHKGECLSNSPDGCQQPCTKRRKFCDHECGNPCHLDQPCPDTPCKTAIIVKCKCGRRSEKMLCLACGSGAMHQTFQKMFSKDLGARIRELQSGHSVSISDVTVSGEDMSRYLDCDEVCAQEERNRKLASALEIEDPNISPSDGEVQYSAFLLEQARKDITFVLSVEEHLRNLAEAALKGTSNQARTHHFRPMKSTQRQIIHELAAHYGCDTTSFDQEPNRNVMASVNKTKAKLPVLSLTRRIERDKPRITPAPVSVSAVRCQVGAEEGNVTTLVHPGNEIKTVDKEESSAPDYFYDDVAW